MKHPENQMLRVVLTLYYPNDLPDDAEELVTSAIENAIEAGSPDLSEIDELEVGEPIIEWSKPGPQPIAPFLVWDEHPGHPVADWQAEVAMNDTRLGYWDWVREQLRMENVI